MFSDEYGNKVSTNSAEAAGLYIKGTHQFLGAEPGVENSFRSAIDADPEFALAHIGYAREMQLRGRSTDMRQALEKAGVDALMKVEGVGPKLAEKIYQFFH